MKIGIEVDAGKEIVIEDRWMRPTVQYPNGSWLHTVDGKVEIATGYYATIHPDKPSPYFHDAPPFFVMETCEYPWENMDVKEEQAKEKAQN